MQVAEELTKSLRSHYTPTGPAIHIVDDLDIEVEYEDHGFIDLFWADVQHGFTVFCDEEIAHILKYKCNNHVFDSNKDYRPMLKLFFYQSIPGLNIEVDLNNHYHAKLMRDLVALPTVDRSERENTLSRIRFTAKKMGLKSHVAAIGGLVLSTDLFLVWRDERGNICG
jgi:hypothetical protein